MFDHISPSSINLFFQCPYRWYLTNLGLEGMVIDDSHLRFGKMIHHMIQQFYLRISDEPTEEEIERLAWNIFYECYDDTLPQKRGLGKRIISNFIKFEKNRLREWKVYKPTLVERRFNLNEYLVGVIDFYCDGIIIDWKTGQYNYMNNDIMRQGGVYKYLLKKAGYRVNKVLFVYLRDNRVVEVPHVTDGWIEQEIRNMESMIKNKHFPKKSGVHCKYCEYRLRCEFDDTCLWEV